MPIRFIRRSLLQDPMINSTHSLENAENQSEQLIDQNIQELFSRIFEEMEAFVRLKSQDANVEENTVSPLQDPTISSTCPNIGLH